MTFKSKLKSKLISGLVAGAFCVGTAQAKVVDFQVDPSPGGTMLFLTSAKDASSSFGTVVTPDDVVINVVGNADFASGFSTIKPIKGGTLTNITFTPTNDMEFTDFAFRGQDVDANQTIDAVITDQNGNVTTIPFFWAKANADINGPDGFGIEAAIPGEFIKSVELVNTGGFSDGFKEGKQFRFSSDSITGVGVPEPATWAMMIAGIGMIGYVTGRRKTNLKLA